MNAINKQATLKLASKDEDAQTATATDIMTATAPTDVDHEIRPHSRL